MRTQDRRKVVIAASDVSAELQLMEAAGRKLGYEIRGYKEGTRVLLALRQTVPAMVILHANMAGVTGLAVCRWMRARERYRNVPVILFSSFNDVRDQMEALASGASRYLLRPLYPSLLRELMLRHLP